MKNLIKKHPMLFAVIVYSILCGIMLAGCFGGTKYAYVDYSDAAELSVPQIVRLKEYYLGLFDGTAAFMDYNVLFGTDHILNVGIVGNPLYFPVVFVPDELLPFYIKSFYIVLIYTSGLAFIFMCRYFGRNPVIAAAAAVMYAFAPFMLDIGLLFTNFTVNMTILPLMIIGMEAVLRKKSGIPLMFASLAAMLCCGLYFYVYQLLATVVFAFVRVIFMKEGSFFVRLFGYGIRGAVYALAGVLISGAVFMPQLLAITGSERINQTSTELLGQAMSLHITDISNAFFGYSEIFALGLMLVPFCIAFMTMKKMPAENKVLIAAGLLCILVPVVSLALCGFAYIQNRWAFALTLAAAYAAAFVMERIRYADIADRIIASLGIVISVFMFEYIIAEKAVIVLLIYMALVNIPPLRRKADCFIRNTDKKHPHILEAAVILLFLISCAMMLMLNTEEYNVYSAVIDLIVVAALLFEKRKLRIRYTGAVCAGVFSAVFLTLTGYSVGDLSEGYNDNMDSVYLPLTEIRDFALENGDDIVRFESCDSSVNYNINYMYDLANTSGFYNLIPGRYSVMMKNSGFDMTTLSAVNTVSGFEHRLPYMAVFGVDYIHSLRYKDTSQSENTSLDDGAGETLVERDIPYCFESIKEYEVGENINIVYKNNYSLPFGFTYKNTVSENEREKLSGADYGINMLYAAAVEENDTDGLTVTPVTNSVGFEMTSEVVAYDEGADITYTRYTLIPQAPVSDGEIYITMNNVKPCSEVMDRHRIILSNGYEILGQSSGSNINRAFNWSVALEDYSFRIGDFDEPITKIEVTTSSEFDSLELTVLPHSEFERCFNELNEYTLENVNFGAGEITGDITVPDDRILALSLQYDEGWSAYVNGEKADVIPVNRCMTGIKLPAGAHSIRLEYNAPGTVSGIIVTVFGIAVSVILKIAEKRRNAA